MNNIFPLHILVLLLAVHVQLPAQVNRNQVADTVTTENAWLEETDWEDETSEVSLTPDELQSLVARLLQAKQRRLTIRRRAYEYQQPAAPAAPDTLLQTEFEALKSYLATELEQLKKAIENQSLTPPPVFLPPAPAPGDTAAQKASEAYFTNYARQMAAMRQAVDAIRQELPKLVDKKDFQMLEKRFVDLQQRIAALPQQSTPAATPTAAPSAGTPDWATKLEQQLQSMRQAVEEIKARQQAQPPVQPTAVAPAELAQTIPVPAPVVPVAPPPTPAPEGIPAWASALQAQITALQEQLASRPVAENTTVERTVVLPPAPDTAYIRLSKLIAGKEKQSLHFENNAFELLPEQLPMLEQTAALLQQHSRLDLLITGFTSAKGSAAYNLSLSEKRAEAVKKQLLQLGIHPSRLFLQYHGVDYLADEDEGRRVELQLMIKRN